MIKTRYAYLDNVRSAAVLLVMAYHVCYLFNGVGVPAGIPGAESIPLFDTLACVFYPWPMVLLFVLAGISARYSLQTRTGGQFLRERAVKLLIPSTLGPFVLHWITGYLNIKMGGGLAYIPPALVYPISVLAGFGPLWFIQLLFLFSCLLVLLRGLDPRDRLWTRCRTSSLPVLFLLFLPMLGASQVLNLPLLTTYRFGIYTLSFLIGYYVLSHSEAQEALETYAPPLAAMAVTGAILYGFAYRGRDYTDPALLQSLPTNLYLWTAVLAILGCAKRYFHRSTPLTGYLTSAGFGLYILHYPILISTCYFLRYHCALPAPANYAIALGVGLAGSLAAYELLRRVPLLRLLVLGRKK